MPPLAEQTVEVTGTASAGEIISWLAESLAILLKRREVLETRMTALLEAHPLAKVLTSMPGVAARAVPASWAEVGDASAFPTPPTWPPMRDCPHHTPFGNLRPGEKDRPAAATRRSDGS